MKIFILGHGKSGTTVFLFKVAGGLPNCQAFSGGDPGKFAGDYENTVYKHTYSERKGFQQSLDYQRHKNPRLALRAVNDRIERFQQVLGDEKKYV